MCGICGFVHTDQQRPADRQLLSSMCDTIRHRGPDAEGLYVNGSVGLGSRRLSIIDLAGGDQPIYNEDRTIAIVFNGEIYNFPTLREELLKAGHHFDTRADTETIVHGYEQWGIDVLNRLNGMFAFALWDNHEKRLFIARDRTGIKPLYYTQTDDAFVFGSELKAILAFPGISRRIDPAALDAYLSFEYVPTPLSIFEGIYKLPPGHFLLMEGGQLTVKRYWDIDLSLSESSSNGSHETHREADYLAELKTVLLEAVEMEMISDVPIGVLLSGGIDSSAVAAMMSQVSPGNVQSFSIGMEDASFDESTYATIVAERLGTKHHERVITPQDLLDLIPTIASFMDEPLADSSIIPTTLLSQFVQEHVKVALGGDGGDEMFAGYSTLQAHRLMESYERFVPRPLRQQVIPAIAGALPTSFNNISFDFKVKRFVNGADTSLEVRHQQWLGSFTTEEKHQILRPHLRRTEDETFALVTDKMANCQAGDTLNRVLYLDKKMYMEGDILPKVDRASMSTSLEVRVPLLNQVLLDYVARLPHRYKLHGLTTKHLLRRTIEDILPPVIRKRGKKGFNIPVAKWLTGPLLDMTHDMLHPDKLRREGFFEAEAVQALLEAHLTRQRDARKPLWTLLTFEMWYDQWAS